MGSRVPSAQEEVLVPVPSVGCGPRACACSRGPCSLGRRPTGLLGWGWRTPYLPAGARGLQAVCAGPRAPIPGLPLADGPQKTSVPGRRTRCVAGGQPALRRPPPLRASCRAAPSADLPPSEPPPPRPPAEPRLQPIRSSQPCLPGCGLCCTRPLPSGLLSRLSPWTPLPTLNPRCWARTFGVPPAGCSGLALRALCTECLLPGSVR